MSKKEKLIPKFAECHKCGRQLLLTQRQIKCDCGLLYEYNPEKTIYPILEFQCGDSFPFRIRLSESVIIGRDSYDRDYVKIRSKYDEMKAENTYMRNIYVSRKHIEILVKEETSILPDSQEIIVRKKCSVEDLGSTNGTELNGSLIRPGRQYDLKHNDVIVLAPKTDLPLTITLKEEMLNE